MVRRLTIRVLDRALGTCLEKRIGYSEESFLLIASAFCCLDFDITYTDTKLQIVIVGCVVISPVLIST